MLYTFEKPFTITTGGEDQEITYIDLIEPSASNINDMSKIDAYIGRMLQSSQAMTQNISSETLENVKKDKENEDSKMKVKDVISLIISSGVDASSAYDGLKKLLPATGSKLNGEFICSGGNYNAIPVSAMREILGAYIVNFTNIFS
jgi:hypothetical protein